MRLPGGGNSTAGVVNGLIVCDRWMTTHGTSIYDFYVQHNKHSTSKKDEVLLTVQMNAFIFILQYYPHLIFFG